ncbi:lytic polysaccharide monooxygenase [Lophiostoma macrostomum CBS 122681]|uniref:lytic cellulose monooxygenase (C4-dehydrogenating) n=1 Tax=Lophiostoma macrostomum CBS 122681 TaxID=1314788 RepID=A0A6A6SN04_9PLEO|nr:lytic polysaccharide monooxygenase [Lophiostoma macrostomum CBS 122681]
MLLPIAAIFLVLRFGALANAHYIFNRFMFNDTITKPWEYVRNITEGLAADSGLADQYMPYYDVSDANIRCGRGGATSGPGTKTATVHAGSTVGFAIGRSADEARGEPYLIYHNGPGMAYLSLSTSPHLSLDAYDGSGPWFKIAYFGPKNDTNWLTRDQPGMNFSIPLTTPPGKYLLRIEHMYVRSAFNTTQFYVECAQIEVVGPGGGEPGPLVRFPGAYDLRDRGIWVSDDVYNWPEKGLDEYKPPGPPVWTG